jgi:lysophospholipid acyltransferase (LPLAT)-like uncharacterized protein
MKSLPRGSKRERVFVAIAGSLIHLVLRILWWSARYEFIDGDVLLARFAAHEPVILSFWHGRLVMMPFAYSGRGACIMNSRHRDGAIVSRAIERLGIEVVHGSSTRGWVGGLKGLLAAHGRGRDLVVVPDGPKGPRCRAKSGVVQLARVTGVPIFPVAFSATRYTYLHKSWDRMLIPKPFTKLWYVVGEAVSVGADASTEDLEEARLLVENRLTEVSRRADLFAGLAAAVSGELLDDGKAAERGASA